MSRSEQQPIHAYVTIRGSRSHRWVSRDASPASTAAPSPFAALVLGHPDGTSTRFELSYRPDASLRDGSEGALVDVTMVSPLAESVTLCRILVPSDGHGEPVPSYPATANEPALSALESVWRQWRSKINPVVGGPVFDQVERVLAAAGRLDHHGDPRPSCPKPEQPSALQRAAVDAYNWLCNVEELPDFVRERDKEIRLRLAAALDAEGINVDDDRDTSFLDAAIPSPVEPYAGLSEEAALELASRSTHYCDELGFTECGIVSKLVRHTALAEDVDCPECRNLLGLGSATPVNASEAAEEMARHHYTEARATTKPLTDVPALSAADPSRAFTGAAEPTGTASAVAAFEGRRS